MRQPSTPRDRSEPVRYRHPKWVYYLLLVAVIYLPLSLLTYYLFTRTSALSAEAQRVLYRYGVRNLSAEQKKEFYAMMAENTPGIWDATPESTVGRVLQRSITKEYTQTVLVSNDAGMRSERPYVPKDSNRFRIICLGDSMVMGTGADEEDRWGDQMEEMLRDLDVAVDGKQIEVYSVGVGGWSAINEASYLSHRISSYAPDIVLVMMVGNDITDTPGILGIGQASYGFTPEHRRLGSGVMADVWPFHFGFAENNVLSFGLGPESTSRWDKSFEAWKRLETVLEETGGRMVFGVLQSPPLFLELSKFYFAKAGLKSPLIMTSYFGERLPHDAHPNRTGHGILAAHYLHVMAELGWLPVNAAALPPLHPKLTTETSYPADRSKIVSLQAEMASTLDEEIAFGDLSKDNVRAILGGIYPGSDEDRLGTLPFGSPKSAFVLRRKDAAEWVLVEVEVPPHAELYPYRLDMHLDGELAATLTLSTAGEAGRHVIKGAFPEGHAPGPAVEITLRTDSYWMTIDDFTMKSYRLVSARQE